MLKKSLIISLLIALFLTGCNKTGEDNTTPVQVQDDVNIITINMDEELASVPSESIGSPTIENNSEDNISEDNYVLVPVTETNISDEIDLSIVNWINADGTSVVFDMDTGSLSEFLANTNLEYVPFGGAEQCFTDYDFYAPAFAIKKDLENTAAYEGLTITIDDKDYDAAMVASFSGTHLYIEMENENGDIVLPQEYKADDIENCTIKGISTDAAFCGDDFVITYTGVGSICCGMSEKELISILGEGSFLEDTFNNRRVYCNSTHVLLVYIEKDSNYVESIVLLKK